MVKPDWDIQTVLPGENTSEFSCTIPCDQIEPGIYRIALQITNPYPKGNPLMMVNATQEGKWLILGQWEKK